jgi:hypothetical protein
MSFPTSLAFGDPSRLAFDSFAIRNFVESSLLAALRAEDRKAALNQAINARQNAFKAKYVNIPAIVSRMISDYSPSSSGSKPNRLKNLRNLSQQQADELNKAYGEDHLTGVVKTTHSKLESKIKSSGESTTKGRSDDHSVALETLASEFDAPPENADIASIKVVGDGLVGENEHLGSSVQTSTSNGSATECQNIENTDYGYRIPFLESQAQNERAQISLIDEQFAQFMANQSVTNLGFTDISKIFTNELSSIDYDVFRLQIAYLNTILMSPLSGTVTGIYKNPGECVKAGEPVIRVENNAEILLVATLINRGPVSIGSTVKVTTTLFDLPGPKTSVEGQVVAARGQREDDHWEVVVKCNNFRNGKPIFPLGYNFDYDDTTVDIS